MKSLSIDYDVLESIIKDLWNKCAEENCTLQMNPQKKIIKVMHGENAVAMISVVTLANEYSLVSEIFE